jgi:two-component system chemotaxis sensor kinase CheA
MTDDRNGSFRERIQNHLNTLNRGLLALELRPGDAPQLMQALLKAARQLYEVAQSAETITVEAISQALLTRLAHLQAGSDDLQPQTADIVYDALDVIERLIDDNTTAPVSDDLVAEMIQRLNPQADTAPPPDDADKTAVYTESDARRVTVSVEMPRLPDEALTPDASAGEELLGIFYTEASEHLVALNEGILQVEMQQAESESDVLHEMNRVAHSLKGAARAVGFGLVETISHALEDAFEQAEAGSLDITPQTADVLYDALDVLQNALDNQPDDKTVIAQVLLQLERLTRHDTPLSADAQVPSADPTPDMDIPPARMTDTPETVITPTLLMRSSEDTLRVPVKRLDALMTEASELLVARMQAETREDHLRALRREHARWQREWRSVRAAYIRLVRRTQDNPDALSPEMATLFKFLEANQRYLTRTGHGLARLGQMMAQDNMQLATLSEQLQEDVSNLRMMPFETMVRGFQRIVRDLAHDLDKQVYLHILGAEVETDKTVLDALKDPLMHLLRNAVDHGLEPPDERRAAEKPPTGLLWMYIEQRGSEIVITVQDDGRGLDLAHIRQIAVERGLLTRQEADNLSDDEARLLVLRAGFSTTDAVTPVSGRGLGLDIVRDRVESLRGRVNIESTPGKGTKIILRVPVSLTRIRAILLDVGQERYALPSTRVERMETLPADAIFTAEGQEMVVLNDRPMPLISLGRLLQTPRLPPRDETLHLMVLHAAEQTVAFEVDYLHSERELVLEPLGDELKGTRFVAGAALPGSGDVIIVLDANDLVRYGSGRHATGSIPAAPSEPVAPRRTRVLVVDDSITTRTLEKTILENAGFDVTVAIDGAEAWQRLPEIEPDVLVTDVEMPQMDGLELTRRVKDSPRWQNLPVILLTSLGKPEQREAGLSAGADAYLIKSRFDQGELLATIRQLQ